MAGEGIKVIIKDLKAIRMKNKDKKPREVTLRLKNKISIFEFADAKGEVSFGENVFWRKGNGFYWKRYAGKDKPLEDVSLVELTDTFG